MLYFKQLLSGVDHADGNPHAASMANFSYALGCTETKECMLVDPTWAPDELYEYVQKDGYTLTGIIATHYHFDHIGGKAYGMTVPGARDLIKKHSVPIYCHAQEKNWVEKAAEIDESHIRTITASNSISIGNIQVNTHHTPGHSPGGICIEIDGKLIVGDTLFQEGCGRTDIPGGDSTTLLKTIKEVFLPLDDSLEVYCGHNYGTQPFMKLGLIKRSNYIFQQI